MSDSINVDTTVTTINIVTIGQQGPAGPKGDPGNFDPSVIENMQNQVDNLETEVDQVKTLAQTNELKISTKTDQSDFEQAQQQIEQNRLAILTKADIQALAMLSQLVDTKADQAYVNQQISNLVGSAPEALNTIYELAAAIQNEQGLIESLNQSVANRVRFDVATQALTEIQKENARTNIGAEKIGTAQQLVSQITAQSLGAATSAQGVKADTALQSGDVAPVALSGLFSSLSGQSKIFDVVFSAYVIGTNTALAATDTLGQMLGKLQAQINANKSGFDWVDLNTVATVDSSFIGTHRIAKRDGFIYYTSLDDYIYLNQYFAAGRVFFTVTDPKYKVRSGTPNVTSRVATGYLNNENADNYTRAIDFLVTGSVPIVVPVENSNQRLVCRDGIPNGWHNIQGAVICLGRAVIQE